MDLVTDAILPRDAGLDPDNPSSVFVLIASGLRDGIAGALITIVDIKGGAPRALGAQMAVLADGRYCGYVSGGCVEAAVAGEAMRCILAGHDEVMRFGVGSPFIDIKLPCGGSIDLHVHVHPDADMVQLALRNCDIRDPFCLALKPDAGTATLVPGSGARERSGWSDGVFYKHYHPVTQLVLIGEGHELLSLAQLGAASGLRVESFMTSEAHLEAVARTGSAVTAVNGATLPTLPVDPFTAIVFLLHDRFKEARLLEAALSYDSFYVGALGSRRTHASRVERLEAAGFSEDRILRLRGPIGLYGPTRTSSALAISVLGEITDARMRFDG